MNISFLLLGLTLLLVSVAAIFYSISDFRSTSIKRHQFFKGIRLFSVLYLMPVFFIIIIVNFFNLIREDFLTFEKATSPVLSIFFALVNILFAYFFVFKSSMRGISLFRRHNRDNMKYNVAIIKSRNGLLYILVMVIATLALTR